MRSRRAAGLLAALVSSACAASHETSSGAALVSVLEKPPSEESYQRLDEVSCIADDPARTATDNRRECVARLRERAWKLSADIVVPTQETPMPGCATCIEIHGLAYRRKLPFESAATPAPRAGSVYVTARMSTGTCAAVTADGKILTAHHVIAQATTVSVSFSDGRHAAARVFSSLPEKDLALLEVALKTPDFLALGDPSRVRLGERVFTLGFPMVGMLGVEPKFSDGTVSALTGLRDAPEVFQVSVPIQPGNSGGPLVTEQGGVIGVVTSTIAAVPFLRATGALPQGLNYAVKIDPVRSLLPAGPPAQAATLAQAIDKAKVSVCLVEAATGDGLLLAGSGFGAELSPTTLSADAFAKLRAQCEEGNPEACLSVAGVLVAECGSSAGRGCQHVRFAKTILRHGCAIGNARACTALGNR